MNFEQVEVGQVVTRLLGGQVPMKLLVTAVDDKFIYCGPDGVGWKFLRNNGAEVDEELGWDGVNRTGSYLSKVETSDEADAWLKEVKECARKDPKYCALRDHTHGLWDFKKE